MVLVFFDGRLRAALYRDSWLARPAILGVVFRDNVFVVETQSLTIVLACVEIHLRLDLKHEVPLVATEELRAEIVFLCI